MLEWKTIVPLVPITVALVFYGCPGGRSNLTSVSGSSAAALADKSPGPKQAGATPATKHALHDSTFSVYHNSDYGVSFRYPRNFALVDRSEAYDADYDAAKAQEQLTAEQPGAVLIAAVTIPKDAYPNATFVSGALQLVINPVVAEETCKSFGSAPDPAWYSATGADTIHGVGFHWRERGSAAGGTSYDNREYAGYAGGTCYEFLLEAAASDVIEEQTEIKMADTQKIMRTLERIVLSLQLQSTTERPKPQALPDVKLFSVEPLFVPHFQNVVRVSWEVNGANAKEVFLRVNCPGPAELNPLPDSDGVSPDAPSDLYPRPGIYRLESIFSCGTFTPIPPNSGSFRLQIENRSPEPITFTLFVFHRDYVTRPERFVNPQLSTRKPSSVASKGS